MGPGGGTDKWYLMELKCGTVGQVVSVGLGGGTDKWYQWD